MKPITTNREGEAFSEFMDVNKMKNASFESISFADWKAKAEESLKGKPLDKLYKETYEGITLKPLYTKEDYDQEWEKNRNTTKRGWKIAQRVIAEDEKHLPEIVETVLTRGQDTVSFSDAKGSLNKEVLEKIFKLALKEEKPLFHITSLSAEGFSTLRTGFSALKGVYSADPITHLLQNKGSQEINNWLDNITYLKQNAPGIRTILVDASPINESGANAVQESAYAVAAGVSYIELLKEAGWTAEEAAGKLVFNFSTGSNFFMEIAKMRAFRSLWKNVLTAYEISVDSKEITISAETSSFTKSKLDPYVNMLRAGNETFSAVLGGADFIHVSPFDEVSGSTSAFSERIARNTQLILSQEALLDKVTDPAGGSYYIEMLTNQLVERAWGRFQEIEKNGGLLKVLEAGTLQEEIRNVWTRREQDISSRKSSLIGTNVYANLEEIVNTEEYSMKDSLLKGLQSKRLSTNFEELRLRSMNLKEKPVAGLILLGKIKSHKARADFVTGFLAAGGIGVIPSRECLTVNDAEKFISDSETKYYVICGRDEDYETMAEDILQLVNTNKAEALVDLAGRLNETKMKELTDAGLNGNIYLGQDMIKKLDALLSRWEGSSNGK